MELKIDDIWHAEVQQLSNEPGTYTYKVYKQDHEILSGTWDSDVPTMFGTAAIDHLKQYLTQLVKDFTDATRELKTVKQVLDGLGDSSVIQCADRELWGLRPQSWGWTLTKAGVSYVTTHGGRAIIAFYFAERQPVFVVAAPFATGGLQLALVSAVLTTAA